MANLKKKEANKDEAGPRTTKARSMAYASRPSPELGVAAPICVTCVLSGMGSSSSEQIGPDSIGFREALRFQLVFFNTKQDPPQTAAQEGAKGMLPAA